MPASGRHSRVFLRRGLPLYLTVAHPQSSTNTAGSYPDFSQGTTPGGFGFPRKNQLPGPGTTPPMRAFRKHDLSTKPRYISFFTGHISGPNPHNHESRFRLRSSARDAIISISHGAPGTNDTPKNFHIYETIMDNFLHFHIFLLYKRGKLSPSATSSPPGSGTSVVCSPTPVLNGIRQ
jgi:hypothetical protein